MIEVNEREYRTDTTKTGEKLTRDMEACLRIGFTNEEIDDVLQNRENKYSEFIKIIKSLREMEED
jgi:CBS-domain-containing membrane protein